LLAIGARPSAPSHEGAKGIRISGPATSKNQGLYQDATSVSLRRPRPEDARDLATMSKIGGGVFEAMRKAKPNPKRKHPLLKAALDALSPSLERDLRERWNKAAAGDAGICADLFQRAVEKAVTSTTAGSPLTRNDAKRKAAREVRELIERATKVEAEPAAEARPSPAHKERSRAKSRKEAKL
jgi:hypothetical protein